MPNKPPTGFIAIFPDFRPMRVKYKDIFDLRDFYKALHEWLLEHDWKDEEDKLDHWENYYGERIAQNGAREIWAQWRPWKQVPEDTRLAYYLDFDWHCIAVTNTEIVRDGKKVKVNKGEVELKIRAYIEKKYETEWKKHPILKHFINIFSKRVYRDTLKRREKELYQETYAMQNFIKQWFKLKRYLPYEESKSFFPSFAWPSHLKE